MDFVCQRSGGRRGPVRTSQLSILWTWKACSLCRPIPHDLPPGYGATEVGPIAHNGLVNPNVEALCGIDSWGLVCACLIFMSGFKEVASLSSASSLGRKAIGRTQPCRPQHVATGPASATCSRCASCRAQSWAMTQDWRGLDDARRGGLPRSARFLFLGFP